jgi:serine/threonine protein kinase
MTGMIPRETEKRSEHRLCLVMERVPGRSLAAELESGRRWTEPEIESMFAEVLSILAYLQAIRPPIIHRDINPKNLILKPDGSIALVDFSGSRMLSVWPTGTRPPCLAVPAMRRWNRSPAGPRYARTCMPLLQPWPSCSP